MLLCAQDPDLKMPHFFADGMVMQRDAKVPVWGTGTPRRWVVVKMAGKKSTARVKKDGTWRATLKKLKPGGPYTLEVKERKLFKKIDTRHVENVLVGDVFLCSGQSNMELPIRRCMDAVANEVKDYTNDNIRYLKFPHQFNYVQPNTDVQCLPWQNITPQNCAEVSGICYFMARELQKHTGVPVGIINSAVGGTQVQAWMPREVLEQFPGYAEELAKPKYHQVNWVDSVRRAENRAGFEWERQMMAADTVVNKWRAEGYDFSAWETVDMFSNWSHGKNGSYWFHTSIDLPDELAGAKAVLRFGAMKDADTIFVNGQYVGNTTYEYPPRVYTVNTGILRAGRNDIVVHLMSQSGMGNFTQGKLYQLEVGEKVFPIAPQLHMAVGSTMPRKPASTYFVDTPTGLYNAMIAPLRDFPVKGMLWYQGESNMGRPDGYAEMLEAMVDAWRKQWKQDFPVVIMQLPGYMRHHGQSIESGWTRIREEQYKAAQNIMGASLAPTFDTGEFNDIHPQDKLTAGLRAAQQMQRLAYGDKSSACDVPLPLDAKANGRVLTVRFEQVGSGLIQRNTLATQGAGSEAQLEDGITDFALLVDGKYVTVPATITGSNTVALTMPDTLLTAPRTTVRYGWDDYPHPKLFTREGVPVPQFQLDVTLPAGQKDDVNRPKVGLVLGGGGAKGAATVGVLKAVEESGVPVDMVVGTSIGSIVGGLYALGIRSAQLDSMFRAQQWVDLFAGSFQGDSIVRTLRQMTGNCTITNFDDLPLPFRCVAVDVKKLREVVLSSGDLATAMRASMAIPVVFKPVQIDGMMLVDGGVLNNLPVDVAQKMGADRIIAVDLAVNKHSDYDTSSLLSLLRPDLKKYNQNCKAADVYINPKLDGYGAQDFVSHKISEMITIGEKAGNAALKKLKKLKREVEQAAQ
jgi:sialate O-acetylesterase